jgi:hypothetical protein
MGRSVASYDMHIKSLRARSSPINLSALHCQVLSVERMATINSWAGSLDDATSYPIKLSCYDTRGLCSGFQLRRHKFESEANAGSHEARLDWIKHVGPLNQFGVCNPVNGHLVAMVLPLCKPERMRLLGYVYECKFTLLIHVYHLLLLRFSALVSD